MGAHLRRAVSNGVANKWYTHEDLHRKQLSALFHDTWCSVGFEHDVPHVGDISPSTSSGVPLLLARGKHGLKVFHNVCSHRGVQLVKKPQSGMPVIRCPYHSWAYNASDGSLLATPHAGGMNNHKCHLMDKTKLGLKEVRSATWMGIVFVNISGQAEAFSDYIMPLARRWSPFMDRQLYSSLDDRMSLDLKTNWKLAVENYCESYHLPWIHPDLNKYSKLSDHYDIIEPGRFTGQGTTTYNTEAVGVQPFPSLHGLPSPWERQAEYVALFPNTLLGVHKDHFFGIILTPAAASRTVEDMALFYFDQNVLRDDYKGARKMNLEMWSRVFEEDIESVESMQLGRSSPAFDGGFFTEAMCSANRSFHDWVNSQLHNAA